MVLKNIPNNIEAEKSVLGAMFISNDALQKACEVLNKDAFYMNNHAEIFDALKTMYDTNVPIDSTTVTTYLKNAGTLKEAGGVEYLTEVLDSVPTAANIDQYIKDVESAALLRRLITVSTEIASSAYQQDKDVSETLDDAERKILAVVKNRRASEFKTIQEVLTSAQKNLELLSKSKGDVTGLATGWADIDRITSGLQPKSLVIVAARPSMGKTAWALNLATNVAINTNKTVAFFNMEMSAEQLANRMISSLGQVDGSKITSGKLLHDDWKRVYEAISQLSDTELYIDDTPGITIGEIKSKCRRLASSNKGLGLIIVDYLQQITSSTNYGANRQQEVADISRALKIMSLELNIPVIALAQLSRSVELRENKRPIMSDLRESGSIEQDADIVAFLYREDYYNKEKATSDNQSVSEFIIGKHRNGPTGSVDLLFKRNTSTFLSMKKSSEGDSGE